MKLQKHVLKITAITPSAICVVIAHSMTNQICVFSQYYTSHIINLIIGLI